MKYNKSTFSLHPQIGVEMRKPQGSSQQTGPDLKMMMKGQ